MLIQILGACNLHVIDRIEQRNSRIFMRPAENCLAYGLLKFDSYPMVGVNRDRMGHFVVRVGAWMVDGFTNLWSTTAY